MINWIDSFPARWNNLERLNEMKQVAVIGGQATQPRPSGASFGGRWPITAGWLRLPQGPRNGGHRVSNGKLTRPRPEHHLRLPIGLTVPPHPSWSKTQEHARRQKLDDIQADGFKWRCGGDCVSRVWPHKRHEKNVGRCAPLLKWNTFSQKSTRKRHKTHSFSFPVRLSFRPDEMKWYPPWMQGRKHGR